MRDKDFEKFVREFKELCDRYKLSLPYIFRAMSRVFKEGSDGR